MSEREDVVMERVEVFRELSLTFAGDKGIVNMLGLIAIELARQNDLLAGTAGRGRPIPGRGRGRDREV